MVQGCEVVKVLLSVSDLGNFGPIESRGEEFSAPAVQRGVMDTHRLHGSCIIDLGEHVWPAFPVTVVFSVTL